MSHDTLTTFPNPATAGVDVRTLNDSYKDFVKTIQAWKSRHQTRRALANLDTHMLQDIGVSEEERSAEVKKFFWEE